MRKRTRIVTESLTSSSCAKGNDIADDHMPMYFALNCP
jgi:hypothetical protein